MDGTEGLDPVQRRFRRICVSGRQCGVRIRMTQDDLHGHRTHTFAIDNASVRVSAASLDKSGRNIARPATVRRRSTLQSNAAHDVDALFSINLLFHQVDE